MDSFDEIVKFITDLFQGEKNIPLHAPVFIGNKFNLSKIVYIMI